MHAWPQPKTSGLQRARAALLRRRPVINNGGKSSDNVTDPFEGGSTLQRGLRSVPEARDRALQQERDKREFRAMAIYICTYIYAYIHIHACRYIYIYTYTCTLNVCMECYVMLCYVILCYLM